jgi:arylsulfatase A-like enzyme
LRIIVLAIVASGLFACGQPPQETFQQPNIILVMTDDQGWGQIGSHGNEMISTPHLDRLATESVEFTRFYVSPVCAPTRASLMTGRYNYRTGVVDTYLGRAMMHGDEVTLAEMLGDAGYRTGIFGKWHLGDTYPMRAGDQGFQQTLVHKGGGIGQPSDPPGTSYFDPILKHNGEQKQFQGYCTDIFFDAAMRFVELNRDQPFFVYIPTNAPHSPYDVPESFIEPYRVKGLSDKDARIYGMITNIDDNMGKLAAKLDELELAENTILIFMTDNGPTTQHFTAGLRDQKTTAFEGGIRVPFFLRWPSQLQAAKVDRVGAHIDVAPTLLAAARVEAPASVEFDGVSLLPLLHGDAAGWPERTIFIQSHRGNQPQLYRNFAAVTQKYKLLQPLSFGEPAPPGTPLQLYDLESDPGEQNDVASEQRGELARLKKQYEDWFEDVSATRGYDPPKIFIGTEHENPVILTRQDWRMVGADGWKDGYLGYWEVDVKSAGKYDIRFRFTKQERAGRAEFKLGEIELSKPFTREAESVTFSGVDLPPGPVTLEARLLRGGKTIGVNYVDVTKDE